MTIMRLVPELGLVKNSPKADSGVSKAFCFYGFVTAGAEKAAKKLELLSDSEDDEEEDDHVPVSEPTMTATQRCAKNTMDQT